MVGKPPPSVSHFEREEGGGGGCEDHLSRFRAREGFVVGGGEPCCSFSGLREVVVPRKRSQPQKRAKRLFGDWV